MTIGAIIVMALALLGCVPQAENCVSFNDLATTRAGMGEYNPGAMSEIDAVLTATPLPYCEAPATLTAQANKDMELFLTETP